MNVSTTELALRAGEKISYAAFKHKPFPHEFLGIPTFYMWNILFMLVLALIFYWLLRGSRRHESPMDLLKKRYVAGEIDKETFLEMKKDLSG